jgi:hypothetical protein
VKGVETMAYEVAVTVYVPDVEAETEDDAINFVTETIEDAFDRPVQFDKQLAVDYSK